MVKQILKKISNNKIFATVNTGIAGYSLMVDTDLNTEPDNVVDTTSINCIMVKPAGNELFVHVKTIDNAGNFLDTTYIKVSDITPPNLTISLNPNIWTRENVDIVAIATDSGSGVKVIKLRNGNSVNSNKVVYTVSQNGVYYFECEDYIGRKKHFIHHCSKY